MTADERYIAHAAPMPDSPAGPDLEYDPDFGSLMELMVERPASMVPGNEDSQQEGGPNWTAARRRAEGLIERTRDLRVASALTVVAMHDQGVEGLAAGLGLVAALIEGLWPEVHPELDADDAMDPTIRANALATLAHPRFLIALRKATLVTDALKTPASLETIEIASGAAAAENEDARSQAASVVASAFNDTEMEVLQSRYASIKSSISAIGRITEGWNNGSAALSAQRKEHGLQTVTQPPPDFSDVLKTLTKIEAAFAAQMPDEPSDDPATEETASAGGVAATVPARGNGMTRADAVKLMDAAADWFRKNEPSSPVPLLIERAKALSGRSFLDVVDELGDGGIAELRRSKNDQMGNQD